MAGVGTSIIGRPRPLPAQRHTDLHHTLNCEEPLTAPLHARLDETHRAFFFHIVSLRPVGGEVGSSQAALAISGSQLGGQVLSQSLAVTGCQRLVEDVF
jgi:hypothetical protein